MDRAKIPPPKNFCVIFFGQKFNLEIIDVEEKWDLCYNKWMNESDKMLAAA